METTKDLIWLPKDLCEFLKPIQDEAIRREAVLKYAEDTKRYLAEDIKVFDEALLSYNVKMDSVKQEFIKAKDSQLNAMYELWESFQPELDKIEDFVSKAKETISPLKTEIESLNKEMAFINAYDLKGFLALLEKISEYYHGETKEMINFLITNYKKEN